MQTSVDTKLRIYPSLSFVISDGLIDKSEFSRLNNYIWEVLNIGLQLVGGLSHSSATVRIVQRRIPKDYADLGWYKAKNLSKPLLCFFHGYRARSPVYHTLEHRSDQWRSIASETRLYLNWSKRYRKMGDAFLAVASRYQLRQIPTSSPTCGWLFWGWWWPTIA